MRQRHYRLASLPAGHARHQHASPVCGGKRSAVFTGASSVAVKRYRYRGSKIPTPWTRNQQPPAADQRESYAERPLR
jgi:hypothetical protein